jgi:hypothetical protein
MNRQDRRREASARDVIARRAAARAARNAGLTPPPPATSDEESPGRGLFSGTAFHWRRVLPVVLVTSMAVLVFSDARVWNYESSKQKNADLFRQIELEQQVAHGRGISAAQQQELDDLRQLNERRRRRDGGW